MALFEKVQRLGSEYHQELLHFYSEEPTLFPLELRNVLAQDVEGSLHIGVDPPGGIEKDASEIAESVTTLIRILEERLNSQQGEHLPFFIKLKLTTALQQLKDQSSSDPTPIYSRIQQCLKFEMDLLKRAESGSLLDQDGLMKTLQVMKKQVDSTGEVVKRMLQEQEATELRLTEKQGLEERLQSLQPHLLANPEDTRIRSLESAVQQGIAQKNAELDSNLQKMIQLRNNFWEMMLSNISSVKDLQAKVFQEKLFIWKFQQQKGANGLLPRNPISLDRVQAYLETLAEILWRCRQQVQETERLKAKNAVFNDTQFHNLSVLLDQLLGLLTNLLNEAFIVEDQPPQVMKKGNKFATAPRVSLLIGNLNIHMNSPAPQVNTCIIREAQARSLSLTDDLGADHVTAITNGTSTFEFNSTTRRLAAKFSSLQLKEIRRGKDDHTQGRRGSSSATAESVMEEKLCMLFRTSVQVGDLQFNLKALSLPVVVTSHGSQDPTAEATIMWDNAFGEMGRVPFQVPNRVSWADLAPVISAKFFQVTGRALTDDNLRFLKGKAFCRHQNPHMGESITWQEFCKDNLPDTNCSFWSWVYAALKNIERKETHLKELWKEGHLLGFVERDVAASMLAYCEPGTFILRFSDSRPGGISISFVEYDRSVQCTKPMDENELKSKRLANTIQELDKLKFLYPGIPKDAAFEKHCSPKENLISPGKPPYVEIVPKIADSVGDSTNSRRGSNCSGNGVGVFVTPPINGEWVGGTAPLHQTFHDQLNIQQGPSSPYSPNGNIPSPGSPATGGMLPAYDSIFTNQQPSMEHSGLELQPINSYLEDIDSFLQQAAEEHQDLLHINIPSMFQQPPGTVPSTTSSPTNPSSPAGGIIML